MKKSVIVLIVLCISFLVVSGIFVWQLGTMTYRACIKPYGVESNIMEKSEYFSSSYNEAREKFLAAASDAGGDINSIQNPEFGPEGEAIFTDVAYFKAENDKDTLVISSGTHGVEGLAGSGIQTGLLKEGLAEQLLPDLNLLMIHAINPYGMAHLRRVNEDNVDLNRNFRNHSLPCPPNPGYEILADVIAPTSISFWAEVSSWWRILWFRLTAGITELQAVVSSGQYTHPTGLFYGGTFDTWSNKTLHSIVSQYLSNTSRIIFVDVHTGLGEYGNGEVILNVPEDTEEYRRAVEIWGEEIVKTTVTGKSVSPQLDASLKLAIPRMLPKEKEVTAVGLEFGTIPVLECFKALRAENWLYQHGGSGYVNEREIKRCFLQAFYPDDDNWRISVWSKGKEVIERAVANLKSKNKIAQ